MLLLPCCPAVLLSCAAGLQLLAVVYSNFAEEEKDKFRKLFLHKREALHHAFAVLTGSKGIEFHDFLVFMQHYKPRIREYSSALVSVPGLPHLYLNISPCTVSSGVAGDVCVQGSACGPDTATQGAEPGRVLRLL